MSKIKAKAKEVVELLCANYPGLDKCYLNYEKDWQLLIATILSAQCTDDRVNIVTKSLFEKYKNIEDFAAADLSVLEEDIKSTGFYHNKAKNIILCAQKLVKDFDGKLPSDIESLTSLAGVGRKTANVVRGHIFHIPSIVVDTHVKRVSYKLGLTKNTDPEKIEYDLMKILPKEVWIKYNQQVIAHGRAVCIARSPKCGQCFLAGHCREFNMNN